MTVHMEASRDILDHLSTHLHDRIQASENIVEVKALATAQTWVARFENTPEHCWPESFALPDEVAYTLLTVAADVVAEANRSLFTNMPWHTPMRDVGETDFISVSCDFDLLREYGRIGQSIAASLAHEAACKWGP